VSSPKSFKLSQLATLLGAELEGDPDKEVIGINSLAEASDSEVSFLAREAYIPQLASSKAGAVICDSETSKLFNGNKIICSNPYLIYANCTKLFKENPTTQEGISKLASIDSSSSVSDSAAISSFVSISADAVIEDDVILMPGVFVGKGSRVGKGSIIHANVSLYDSVELGKDCIIHSGAVIGSDGLGFAKENNEWVKIEHLGRVLIGNNVEIGSNSTVDRGSIGETVIGENVK
jgi:UDP-3-O-[3-hydroxymyristoyl] glucosamine N-acyltransferase